MDRFVDDLNREIERLTRARNVLLEVSSRRRGRHHGRVGAPPGRVLSADAKKRISEGMKKRWAERRRAQGGRGQKAA
jgi:hypothetical protein